MAVTPIGTINPAPIVTAGTSSDVTFNFTGGNQGVEWDVDTLVVVTVNCTRVTDGTSPTISVSPSTGWITITSGQVEDPLVHGVPPDEFTVSLHSAVFYFRLSGANTTTYTFSLTGAASVATMQINLEGASTINPIWNVGATAEVALQGTTESISARDFTLINAAATLVVFSEGVTWFCNIPSNPDLDGVDPSPSDVTFAVGDGYDTFGGWSSWYKTQSATPATVGPYTLALYSHFSPDPVLTATAVAVITQIISFSSEAPAAATTPNTSPVLIGPWRKRTRRGSFNF